MCESRVQLPLSVLVIALTIEKRLSVSFLKSGNLLVDFIFLSIHIAETQTQLNDQLACRSYISQNTLTGVFLLEKIMDEETRTRLRHIRNATKVNKEHAENTRRQSVERHERSRAQVKAEIYDNRNIDYRKHMRF